MKSLEALSLGIQNLLVNCAQLQAGESVLIVQEDPSLGWYDEAAAVAVIDEARKMQAAVTVYQTGQPDNLPDLELESLRENHDCTIFFARVGDQERFSEPKAKQRSIMCYARNADMLASPFSGIKHQAMLSLKQAIDQCYFNATEVEISCPLGSLYSGQLPKELELETADVTILRFPIGVHSPISSAYFSGRIALSEYLTSTGCKVYEPDFLPIEKPVFAEIEGKTITGFTGGASDVRRIKNHYRHVAEQFSLNATAVCSWHAGIHQGCSYSEAISDNPDRWGNNIFMCPSNLHFHSCTDVSMGEICWNIANPTIKLDGEALWENGLLCLSRFSETRRCLEEWPELLTTSSERV